MENLFTPLTFIGWLLAFGCSWLVVLTQRWHGGLTLDGTDGVQKMHLDPIPRVGGVSVLLGVVGANFLSGIQAQSVLTPLLWAGLPAFAFGLAEDFTKRVGVTPRLLATMASGVLAWWLTGVSLTRVDVWGLDAALQWVPLSVLFTAFAVGGLANAINIIDGFNGLAGLTSILAFLGLGCIAYAVGDAPLVYACIVLAAAVFGFFCVNWPFGKLFMGDGGSYFVGFSLGWIAVLLAERNEMVSPFAVLLVCAHPVTEVLFSIYRRKVRKQHPGMPDRLHFHSLVKRRYVSCWFGSYSPVIRNSITGLLVGCMTVPPVVLVQFVYSSPVGSVLSVLAFGLLYVTLYARMVRHRWVSPISFVFVKPVARSC